MDTFRAAPVVRVLSAVVTGAYRLALVFGALLLIAVPALELFADTETLRGFSIGVVTRVELEPATVSSAWGGPLVLDMQDAEGSLRVPMSTAPAWFRMFTYGGLAIIYSLVLVLLRQLRSLVRRIRAGAPFDERNVADLRVLGALLILIDVLGSAWSFGLSQLVLRAMGPPAVPVTSSFSMNGTAIFIGLVLCVLAEIFRRGSVLEDEHAHVV